MVRVSVSVVLPDAGGASEAHTTAAQPAHAYPMLQLRARCTASSMNDIPVLLSSAPPASGAWSSLIAISLQRAERLEPGRASREECQDAPGRIRTFGLALR